MFESTILIFLAEMADKTQLMMMALSTQYSSGIVMTGLCIGAITISYLSTMAGHFLTHLIPIAYLQVGASILFLLFGFGTLLQKEEETTKYQKRHRFPVLSIAVGFLIAELGDKTQLSTMALAADQDTISVFIAASLGLILANFFGIFLGKAVLSKIDDQWMRLGSSLLFLFFGMNTLFEIIAFSASIRFFITGCIALCFFIICMRFLQKEYQMKR